MTEKERREFLQTQARLLVLEKRVKKLEEIIEEITLADAEAWSRKE